MIPFHLDHVGIAVHDLDAAAEAYRRLGFTLSDLSHHVFPGPPPKQRGTSNRCVMLKQGYVELIGVTDPVYQGRLREHLKRYQGLHIVAFGTADIEAAAIELTGRGIAVSGARRFSRPIVERGKAVTAEFSVVDIPAPSGDGYYIVIEHLTRDALWQPHLLGHANGAKGLVGIIVCVDDPGRFARSLAAMLGGPCEEGEGGHVVSVGRTRVEAVDPAGLARRYAGVAPPALPFVAGMVLSVERIERARVALDAGGIECRMTSPRSLWVAPDAGCGAVIEFVQE